MKDVFVIIADRASAAELNSIHDVVKANSDGWWHRYTAAWVVFGKSAGEWTNLLKPIVKSAECTVLVVRMADPSSKARWSMLGSNLVEKAKWFEDQLPKAQE